MWNFNQIFQAQVLVEHKSFFFFCLIILIFQVTSFKYNSLNPVRIEI